ncbi:DUF1120 domain-containing protein [Erwinia sp. BNK-24-b]|uniref:DUF1120 domain-containing protein n=1 Tax=unclassified Erwinia TaxID=2622719 RepID=UPI0039BFBFAB
MFKSKIAMLAVTSAVSFLSLPALAAESAQVNVKGTLVPTACNINISGIADFGSIVVADIPTNGALGSKTVNYNIACNGKTSVAFSAKADELTNNALQGSLGQDNNTSIGYYMINTGTHADADGESRVVLASQNNGVTWLSTITNTSYQNLQLDGSSLTTWGTVASDMHSNGTASTFSNVKGTFNISAFVNKSLADTLTDKLSFETNTTLTLQYL